MYADCYVTQLLMRSYKSNHYESLDPRQYIDDNSVNDGVNIYPGFGVLTLL